MWISPNHPNPPRRPEPPRETGEVLATFPRSRGEELRVSLSEFEGHPYLALRVWAAGSNGDYWPVKGKGVSVRLAEVHDLAEVLAGVAAQLGDAGGRLDPRPPDPEPSPAACRGRGARGRIDPADLPPLRAVGTDAFDEFEGEDN